MYTQTQVCPNPNPIFFFPLAEVVEWSGPSMQRVHIQLRWELPRKDSPSRKVRWDMRVIILVVLFNLLLRFWVCIFSSWILVTYGWKVNRLKQCPSSLEGGLVSGCALPQKNSLTTHTQRVKALVMSIDDINCKTAHNVQCPPHPCPFSWELRLNLKINKSRNLATFHLGTLANVHKVLGLTNQKTFYKLQAHVKPLKVKQWNSIYCFQKCKCFVFIILSGSSNLYRREERWQDTKDRWATKSSESNWICGSSCVAFKPI